MIVKFERISDLFGESAKEMLNVIKGTNCCHWNSAMVCCKFNIKYCIDYCEGYMLDDMGHAWNVYTDSNGIKHYFDTTQECNYAKGLISTFNEELELVEEFGANEIVEIFNNDGYSHLVSVETLRGLNRKEGDYPPP